MCCGALAWIEDGGAAALRIAALATDRVLSIVGLNSVMPSGFDGTAAANIGADETTAAGLLAAYAAGRDALSGMVGQFDAKASEADTNTLCDTVLNDMTEESYKTYFGVWAGCAFTEEVKGLATKTIFVVGEQDAAMAMNYCQPTLDAMPNATAVTVVGGHFAPLSNTDGALVKAVNAFFSA